MKKLFLGVVTAGVVYFVWCAVSWTVIPWYNSQMKRLPEETLIRDTLKVVVQQPGFYVFPSKETPTGKLSGAEFKNLWTKGPVGFLVISLNDPAPITSKRIVVGAAGSLVTALLLGWILFAARKEANCVMSRTLLSAGLGVLVWMGSDFVGWTWWNFPLGYTLVSLADRLIGFALMGLVFSSFLREPVKE